MSHVPWSPGSDRGEPRRGAHEACFPPTLLTLFLSRVSIPDNDDFFREAISPLIRLDRLPWFGRSAAAKSIDRPLSAEELCMRGDDLCLRTSGVASR